MSAKLYLIPSTLGDSASVETIPAATLSVLHTVSDLIVESPKQARRFLRCVGVRLSERTITFSVLDEHTAPQALGALLTPVIAGRDIGLLSDAGCPAIADPGAQLIRLAHSRGIAVVPLVGPSSITLALMASGLNGQRFVFHGYLPIEPQARRRALAALERQAIANDQTQVMIETPYRNNRLLAAILATCSPDCWLCVATDLTLPTQSVATRRIVQWRRDCPDIDRRPSVFLLGSRNDT